MDFREFEIMYKAEDRHWWYRGLRSVMFRRAGLRAAAEPRVAHPRRRLWHGRLPHGPAPHGPPHAEGIDYSEAAIFFCRNRRGMTNVQQASITDMPFPDNTFDLTISCDVLCDAGAANETAALGELYRTLRPGGRLFLNLPAYTFLRSEHDQATDVDRRYTMRGLRAGLDRAGFEVERISHWNAVLFPLVLAVRLSRRGGRTRGKHEARSDIHVPPAPINRLLTAIVTLESRLMDYMTIPFGSSIACVARKPARPGKEI